MTKEAMLNIYSFRYCRSFDGWALHHSIFYNGLLDIDILPTHFMDYQCLHQWGIARQIMSMMECLGIYFMVTNRKELYPAAVRQFLASMEIYFVDYNNPITDEGQLAYFFAGRRYEMTIHELCLLYGFPTENQRCSIPPESHDAMSHFWSQISSYSSFDREALIRHIRHPLLRIFALILRETILITSYPEITTNDLLYFILLGLDPAIYTDLGFGPDLDLTAPNLGYLFCSILLAKKFEGLGRSLEGHFDLIGSLLTTIFHYHRLDLRRTPHEDRILLIDSDYLALHGTVCDNLYEYNSHQNVVSYCRLPHPRMLSIDSATALEFSEHIDDRLAPSTSHSTVDDHYTYIPSLGRLPTCPLHGHPLENP